MTIPMVDLKGQYQQLKTEIDAAIIQALGETRYILGPNVQAFEKECADYLGVKHALGCANGTDALHLGLLAAGVKPGDEVITTAFTFIATAEAIRYVGATPIFVDILPGSLNIDPVAIESAITAKTSAILPVHLFGQPANMNEIMALAEEHGLAVVEDCAQSIGSRYQGKATGTFGVAGCFSFFPSKNLGCYGDGGLVITDDDATADTIRTYRNHGSSRQYYHDVIGFNSRLDELQAVILRIKLRHLDQYNANRLRVAQTYNRLLSGSRFETPQIPDDRDHIFHQYTLLCDNRDSVREAVLAKDVSCAVYYPVPLHRQKAFADTKQPELPVTEQTSLRCLSFPVFPEMSDKQIETVCEAILSA